MQNAGRTGTPAAAARTKGPSGNGAGAPKNGTRQSPRCPVARSTWKATMSPRRSAPTSSTEISGLARRTKRTPPPGPPPSSSARPGSCSGAMTTWTRRPNHPQHPPGELPVPEVRGDEDRAAATFDGRVGVLLPAHAGHVAPDTVRRAAVQGEQVGEADAEVLEEPLDGAVH